MPVKNISLPPFSSDPWRLWGGVQASLCPSRDLALTHRRLALQGPGAPQPSLCVSA